MFVKQILSLAAAAGVSSVTAGPDNLERNTRLLLSLGADAAALMTAAETRAVRNLRHDQRKLQRSIGCLMQENPPLECCPDKDTDAVCNLLWCVKVKGGELTMSSLQDDCDCVETSSSCWGIAHWDFMVPGLRNICVQSSACCPGDDTTNPDFEGCMADAIDSGELILPDIGSLIPGGIPEGGIPDFDFRDENLSRDIEEFTDAVQEAAETYTPTYSPSSHYPTYAPSPGGTEAEAEETIPDAEELAMSLP